MKNIKNYDLLAQPVIDESKKSIIGVCFTIFGFICTITYFGYTLHDQINAYSELSNVVPMKDTANAYMSIRCSSPCTIIINPNPPGGRFLPYDTEQIPSLYNGERYYRNNYDGLIPLWQDIYISPYEFDCIGDYHCHSKSPLKVTINGLNDLSAAVRYYPTEMIVVRGSEHLSQSFLFEKLGEVYPIGGADAGNRIKPQMGNTSIVKLDNWDGTEPAFDDWGNFYMATFSDTYTIIIKTYPTIANALFRSLGITGGMYGIIMLIMLYIKKALTHISSDKKSDDDKVIKVTPENSDMIAKQINLSPASQSEPIRRSATLDK